jgi:hypothetical protein
VVSEEDVMDDQFMHGAWRQPRPEFVHRLRETLDRQDLEMAVARVRRPALRAAGYFTAAFLATGAFALPSVRAGAAAFLDLFRVVNFAPVTVQPARIEALVSEGGIDLPNLLGRQVQMVKDPGPPREVADAAAASAVSGIAVRMPAWLPDGMAPTGFAVSGDRIMDVKLDVRTLNGVLDALGIDDLRVPETADGQTATLNVPPIVQVRFRDPRRGVTLFQARQPVAALPTGTDIGTLAEIGLRVLGVEPNEAHQFARNVDWRTTLLVPVPASVGSFQQVEVQGHPALLIEGVRRRAADRPPEPFAQLMWSTGSSVFALVGNIRPQELYEMAQSVQ